MSFRLLRNIQADADRYRQDKEMKEEQKRAPKGKKTKAPMQRRNRTMENIMRQKVGGEDWATARKRLLVEANKRKPEFIASYGEKFRQQHMQNVRRARPSKFINTKKKKCKNCPK